MYELEDALKTLSTLAKAQTRAHYKYLLFLKGELIINTTSMPLMNWFQARKILRRASWLCLNGVG